LTTAGRPSLPDVVSVPGSLDTSPLLTSGDVTAIAVPIAPPADGGIEVQPRGDATATAIRYGLDLANLAERAGSDSHEETEGGTGFGARVVLRRLENLA
jgi:leucyl aminopeptidase